MFEPTRYAYGQPAELTAAQLHRDTLVQPTVQQHFVNCTLGPSQRRTATAISATVTTTTNINNKHHLVSRTVGRLQGPPATAMSATDPNTTSNEQRNILFTSLWGARTNDRRLRQPPDPQPRITRKLPHCEFTFDAFTATTDDHGNYHAMCVGFGTWLAALGAGQPAYPTACLHILARS